MPVSCGGVINAEKKELKQAIIEISQNKSTLLDQRKLKTFVEAAETYCATSNKENKEDLLNTISNFDTNQWGGFQNDEDIANMLYVLVHFLARKDKTWTIVPFLSVEDFETLYEKTSERIDFKRKLGLSKAQFNDFLKMIEKNPGLYFGQDRTNGNRQKMNEMV